MLESVWKMTYQTILCFPFWSRLGSETRYEILQLCLSVKRFLNGSTAINSRSQCSFCLDKVTKFADWILRNSLRLQWHLATMLGSVFLFNSVRFILQPQFASWCTLYFRHMTLLFLRLFLSTHLTLLNSNRAARLFKAADYQSTQYDPPLQLHLWL